MPLAVIPKSIPYKGLLTVPFITFTTTYPTKNGAWDFAINPALPMEARGYLAGGVAGTLTGLFCRAIDLSVAGGYTTLSVGDNANADEQSAIFYSGGGLAGNSGIGGSWRNGRYYGWCYDNGATLNPATFDYPLILGNNLTFPLFNLNFGYHLPLGVPNTGAPDGQMLPNIDSNIGAMNAVFNNLADVYVSYAGGSNPIAANPTLNLFLNNQKHIVCGRPHGSQTYMLGLNTVSGAQATVTDFVVNAFEYLISFQNPPGGFDVNTLMAGAGNGLIASYPCFGGFIYVGKDTQTVEGFTLNGYAIFVAEDFSFYTILRLLGADGGTVNWQGAAGAYHAKFDTTGAFWMKNVNNATTLFVSSGSVIKQLPIYPPLPIPDRMDFDPAVAMMRARHAD